MNTSWHLAVDIYLQGEVKQRAIINDSLRNATTNRNFAFGLYSNIEGDEGFDAITL